MIFPLSERDESEIQEMVRGKNIQKEIARAFPVVGPAKNFKSIEKTPSVGVKLSKRDFKSVEDLDLEVRKGKAEANKSKKAVVKHKEVGGTLMRARFNPLVGTHALCLVEGDWTRWDILFWGSSKEVHGIPKFHIYDMEL
jgi:hypothetical protein